MLPAKASLYLQCIHLWAASQNMNGHKNLEKMKATKEWIVGSGWDTWWHRVICTAQVIDVWEDLPWACGLQDPSDCVILWYCAGRQKHAFWTDTSRVNFLVNEYSNLVYENPLSDDWVAILLHSNRTPIYLMEQSWQVRIEESIWYKWIIGLKIDKTKNQWQICGDPVICPVEIMIHEKYQEGQVVLLLRASWFTLLQCFVIFPFHPFCLEYCSMIKGKDYLFYEVWDQRC